MLPVYESVFESQEMMVVIFVKFAIQLQYQLADTLAALHDERTRSKTDTSIMLWLK